MVTEDSPPARLGLVAGYGAFPLEIAGRLQQQGIQVVAVAVREEANPAIEQYAVSTTWLRVGQLGAMIKAFQAAAVDQVIFAGKVRKLHLFRNFQPDIKALSTLAALPDRRDDTVMLAVVDTLAKGGIKVLPQTAYAQDMLAEEGVLCGPKPGKAILHDMHFGCRQARGIAALDIGQTVVVQDGAVLAVEAIEGTDAAIRRGGPLGSGKAVVVKVAKPNQDLRFDVPAVGPDTIKAMADAGCRALAVEAGKTLLLKREELAALAKQTRISVYGIAAG